MCYAFCKGILSLLPLRRGLFSTFCSLVKVAFCSSNHARCTGGIQAVRRDEWAPTQGLYPHQTRTVNSQHRPGCSEWGCMLTLAAKAGRLLGSDRHQRTERFVVHSFGCVCWCVRESVESCTAHHTTKPRTKPSLDNLRAICNAVRHGSRPTFVGWLAKHGSLPREELHKQQWVF